MNYSVSPQQKVEYYDALVNRHHLTNLRDTAKQLGWGQKEFIQYLLDHKYLYRDQRGKLKPYSRYIPKLFSMKEFERNGKAGVQTLVTTEGKETFRQMLREYMKAEYLFTVETFNQTSD